MAGHSKFKNIMYRKGAQDKKRAGLFSKLSKEITVAAKLGSPDPDQNSRLRSAIQLAKASLGEDIEGERQDEMWEVVKTIDGVAF